MHIIERGRNRSRDDGITNSTRLAHKGHKVTVFNRESKIEKLLTNGTTNLKTARHPKEIGDTCDIAIVCVKDYQAVKYISFMTGGLIETTNADLVVIQCSTISPDESGKIADLYSKKQINMLSIPMSGEITLIEAGPKAAYEFAECTNFLYRI